MERCWVIAQFLFLYPRGGVNLHVLLFFLKLFLHGIAWLGHLRILIDCVIISVELRSIESLGTVYTAAGRESLGKQVLLVYLGALDREGRVSSRLLILFTLLSFGDITEKTACFRSLSLFILLHH